MKTYLVSIVLITFMWIIALYNLKLSLKNYWNLKEFNSILKWIKYIYTMKLLEFVGLLIIGCYIFLNLNMIWCKNMMFEYDLM